VAAGPADTNEPPTDAVDQPVPETTSASADSALLSTCFDDKNDGAGNFDLLNASISRSPNGESYVFSATAIGPWQGRFGGIAFAIYEGQSSERVISYVVSGGQDDDGETYTSIDDIANTSFDEPDPGSFLEGRFSASVSADQLDRVSGTPFDWEVVLTLMPRRSMSARSLRSGQSASRRLPMSSNLPMT